MRHGKPRSRKEQQNPFFIVAPVRSDSLDRMAEDNPFEYFKTNGFEVPFYIRNMLNQLGFIGFRIISDISVDQLEKIISHGKKTGGHSSEFLSFEEKENI